MKNIISKYINVQKPYKVLTESDSSSDIKVYMNTWKNYNEYVADLEKEKENTDREDLQNAYNATILKIKQLKEKNYVLTPKEGTDYVILISEDDKIIASFDIDMIIMIKKFYGLESYSLTLNKLLGWDINLDEIELRQAINKYVVENKYYEQYGTSI